MNDAIAGLYERFWQFVSHRDLSQNLPTIWHWNVSIKILVHRCHNLCIHASHWWLKVVEVDSHGTGEAAETSQSAHPAEGQSG